MHHGKMQDVRSKVTEALRPVAKRLGGDADKALASLPDALVEWLRVSSLLMVEDWGSLEVTKLQQDESKIVNQKTECDCPVCEEDQIIEFIDFEQQGRINAQNRTLELLRQELDEEKADFYS